MASGFGTHGERGRCYELWSAFVHCAHDTALDERCALIRGDYIECLHFKKLYDRQQAVKREKKRLQSEGKPVVRPRTEPAAPTPHE